MTNFTKYVGYHSAVDAQLVNSTYTFTTETKFSYDFKNFFHPYAEKLLEVLNRQGLDTMMGPATQAIAADDFAQTYTEHAGPTVAVTSYPRNIDESDNGPYSCYNWELFYHVPLTVAVHLSKAQRFAEARTWFHYVFDPTCTDDVPAPGRYWKFLRFRNSSTPFDIRTLLTLLSTPDAELDAPSREMKTQVLAGYEEMKRKPFHPHAVARTRPLAYQYNVVMKYLDNLIAWGDSLFLQDTIESINEATQRYVMAANLLGPRPQKVPATGRVQTRTYAQLKAGGLDAMGNLLVPLEGEFPLSLTSPSSQPGDTTSGTALFGIGRTLYFCVPNNAQLLTYWDTVADRLYKIRNCMNIQGVVRQLALFDPPLDPGMLVKAAAAGIDVGSILAGTSQPAGPLRALPMIRTALELAGEVRALGAALLTALERQDGEHLGLLRQQHEIKIQQLAQDVRFLQWKNAEQATETLLRARQITWDRYAYQLRLQGLAPDSTVAPELPALARRELTEDNFDDVYAMLVEQYDQAIPHQGFPNLAMATGGSPSEQSGATSSGALFLNAAEDAELNTHLPSARDLRLAASVTETVASVLTFIPEFNIDLHFWGLGGSSKIFGGSKLSDAAKIGAEISRTIASWHSDQAGITSRTGSVQRRADEWVMQANAAARELAHAGRQIISSLIAEQIARREYESVKAQITNSQEVEDFLQSKFTTEELHSWMSGELSRLYYQWYRFAFDSARKAEQTMKLELRRAEVDATSFVQFNYWDAGRRGLLAGEGLQADVKRMEVSFHENNRRELELTRHVSLRQLDPLALLRLKAIGTATFTIPEWLFDRDYPGHYLRRIKRVSVSVPSVVGPFTPVPCQLSLQRSSMRVSPLLADDTYARQGTEDARFVDLFAPIDQIATSSGTQDAGVFDISSADERLMPFENAGAISTWQVDLPKDLRGFDYSTISDVMVHLRYTARQGGDLLGAAAVSELKTAMTDVSSSQLALLMSLRYDFPTEWAVFTAGGGDLRIDVGKGLFPYLAQGRTITVADKLELYSGSTALATRSVDTPATMSDDLNSAAGVSTLTMATDAHVLTGGTEEVFLVIRYALSDA
jgi:Tc toxin complex TcA C-terminal TcB-binding domain